jgi:hypothetical protein
MSFTVQIAVLTGTLIALTWAWLGCGGFGGDS